MTFCNWDQVEKEGAERMKEAAKGIPDPSQVPTLDMAKEWVEEITEIKWPASRGANNYSWWNGLNKTDISVVEWPEHGIYFSIGWPGKPKTSYFVPSTKQDFETVLKLTRVI